MGTVVQFPRHRIHRELPIGKRQLAQVLGRSPRWVQLCVNERGMPHFRAPNGILEFRLSAVLEWLEEERRTA